jgi:hypothetical protein
MPCYLAAILVALFSIASADANDMRTGRLAENESASPEPMQIASMWDITVGDHWTYDLKDEIADEVIQTRKVIVTDMANNQIATRLDDAKTGQSWTIIYDRSWNILRDGSNRYSPNSGTGFQFPLKLNAQWRASVDEVSGSSGDIWKISVNARVTSQENITTKAGTFATYIIETTQLVRNVKSPTQKSQISTRTWFSPDINHWVRRSFIRRENGLIIRNQTFELVEYGRKSTK